MLPADFVHFGSRSRNSVTTGTTRVWQENAHASQFFSLCSAQCPRSHSLTRKRETRRTPRVGKTQGSSSHCLCPLSGVTVFSNARNREVGWRISSVDLELSFTYVCAPHTHAHTHTHTHTQQTGRLIGARPSDPFTRRASTRRQFVPAISIS